MTIWEHYEREIYNLKCKINLEIYSSLYFKLKLNWDFESKDGLKGEEINKSRVLNPKWNYIINIY